MKNRYLLYITGMIGLMRLIKIVLSCFLRGALSLRYKIRVNGFDELNEKTGMLFLPNHPAEVDPFIVYTLLAKRYQPRPLVTELFYYLKGLRWVMAMVRAMPLPDFDLSLNTWKFNQVEKCFLNIKKHLQLGDNFLIYPSGCLKRQGMEKIGGTSLVHNLIKELPETPIVLVRTDGLWGSSFSCAPTGKTPNHWKMLWRGVKIVLKNGVFFTPRRCVTVSFQQIHDTKVRQLPRLDFNQYLEKWFNRYQGENGSILDQEPLRIVLYFCFPFLKGRDAFAFVKKNPQDKVIIDVPEDIQKLLFKEIKKLSNAKSVEIEMDLSYDLGLDSLDIAHIYALLGDLYNINIKDPSIIHTVKDLLELMTDQLNSQNKKKCIVDQQEIFQWPKEPDRPEVWFPKGETIPACFLETVKQFKNCVSCGDSLYGLMTYQQMKRAVLILARKFQQIPDRYIGVLLPSSIGCYLIILATIFAGKIPVMINWTAGSRSVDFIKKILNLNVVFSSRRFLERAHILEIGSLDQNIILMEDFRKTISIWDKLWGCVYAKKSVRCISKYFGLELLNKDDDAIILFTSGTESDPKGVPLTHKNILSNQQSAFNSVVLFKNDIMYGVLPPFHSFGMSLTGILPILCGMRVFFSPDPTDTYQMVSDIYSRKTTIVCCAPSFYRALFSLATPDIFDSVRLFVAGAEKATQELFEYVKNLRGNKELIEGYGITECSPCVTINRTGRLPQGVGWPVDGVKVCIINPETLAPVQQGERGEVLISGDNVFKGYLKNNKNPFVSIDNALWYRSGDLGFLNDSGALMLAGRLGRFIKVGGEMVSLSAVEEALVEIAVDKGMIQKDAMETALIVGVKEGERSLLVLFTTFPFSNDLVNQGLREKGFPPFVKIYKTFQIDKIPLTGTGKVHLGEINKYIQERVKE